MIYLSVWINMRDTKELATLISKNTKKVVLFDSKMKIVLLDKFPFRRILLVN